MSQCANAVKVWPVGDSLVVFFVGERLGANVTLTLYTDELADFIPELFQNRTNDLLARNSDVVYANLEVLDVWMGKDDLVTNVRGTTAVTTVKTQSGDDRFFISSEANQNRSNSVTVDFLHGFLDYVEEDLYLVASEGRHRLMMSDESSSISKGYGIDGALEHGPAVFTRESFTDIHPLVGDIFFTADGGHWADGVDLWLGVDDDRIDVESVPSNPVDDSLATMTAVHCGNGSDTMNVRLISNENEGSIFVANGQFGNDTINASESSLSVILFGDGDDDTLVGGSNNDVVIGGV